MSAGLAEIVKAGAIADAGFFEWLESNMPALVARDPEAVAHAVQRSCEIKATVVAEDEREAGRRAILNFGHTFGHAIEHSQGYGEWLRPRSRLSRATAAGMVMAARLSGIESSAVERLSELLKAANLPVAPPLVGSQAMLDAMGMDKKVLDKKLRFVVLESLGQAVVTSDYDRSLLDEVLEATNE